MDVDVIHLSPFYELTALLLLAAATGYAGQILRQPLIVSFIAVGVLAGPSVLGIVKSKENIELLAELGVAVLLFLVGLKLDVKLIRTIGRVALATGLGQVLFTSLLGFGIGKALGMSTIAAFYIAVALTFSSTIIIVKLLSDKKELDSLHGRIALGFLIVQDLVVVLGMLAISVASVSKDTGPEPSLIFQMFNILVYLCAVLLSVVIFIRIIATPLISRIAQSHELLMIFAISWAALLSTCGSHFGFSKELGGLVAGISLASTPYREAIFARLSSLRDFLLLFFFIALGAQLEIGLLKSQFLSAMAFSAFVLVGNPLIVMTIMGFMGYRKRTGFLAGLTVAQISEFSLLFTSLGVSLGHLPQESLGLVTLVGLVTIALSVYMITYSHVLYRLLEPTLEIFERRSPFREEQTKLSDASTSPCQAILFGLGRYGTAIADQLREDGLRVLAVDFNPDVVRRWRDQGGSGIYGDACDQEFIESLSLSGVQWVISALPQHDLGLTHEDPRLILINSLRQHNYSGKIAVSTYREDEVDHLKKKGADIVFLPFCDAAIRAVERLLAHF